MANEKQLNTSEIILLAMTRGMLGAGIGFLAAGKLSREQRTAAARGSDWSRGGAPSCR